MRTPDAVSARSPQRGFAIALAVCAVAIAAAVALPAPARAAASPPWFSPNVKVNVPPAYSAFQPSIAVGSNGVAYLAFSGWGGSSTQQDVFFSRSSDGGRTWTVPLKVNNDVGAVSQSDPSLAVDHNNDLYIAWTDSRLAGSAPDIYFAKSTDGGQSFSPNVLVNVAATAASQSEPTVAVDGLGMVYVAWTDTRNMFTTGPDIYLANSTDRGFTFNPSVRVNANDATSTEQGRPALAVAADRTVHAAWEDPRIPARGRDIYASKSTDLGASWAPGITVSDDTSSATQAEPAIGVNATGAIFVVWTDYRSANTAPDVYASRSTNAGASFAANVKVNDDVGASLQSTPALAVRTGEVVAAWTDGRTFGGSSVDVYWSSSPDGLTWGQSRMVNEPAGATAQLTPSVAFDLAGDVFAAWYDTRSGGQDVFAATLDVMAPLADAGGDTTVAQGVPASFDASGTTDNLAVAEYDWDFGDGSSASGVAVEHAYAVPGVYTATLTARDYSGNEDTATVVVTVQDTEAPVIRGAGDRTVDEDEPLFFDASASTDNVGVASWLWDFGDNTTGMGATASHVYGAPGTYTATLRVRDAAGNEAVATMTITVRTVSPKASDLLGMIQVLGAVVIALAVLLALVGFLAYTLWRRSRGGPGRGYAPPPEPPESPPRMQDPLDMPPPTGEPPRAP